MAAMSREAGNTHWGAGHDAREGVLALLAALDAPNPPRRLVLGGLGAEVVELHQGRRQVEAQRWGGTSRLELAEPAQ
jgi:hypothetical protein